jgi:methionyl-tRNA formyltransferase
MKLIFAGTPSNAALALRLLSSEHEIVLVITREDAVVGRHRELQPSEVAQEAARLGLKVLKINKFDEAALAEVRSSQAEHAIVIAFGALIPKAALDIVSWWNIHFSMLPKWRGASPLQQSIIHNDGIGVTLFEIDAGLDTGPILAQKELKLWEDESYTSALERFTIEGVELAKQALKISPTPVSQAGIPTYAPKISRMDARLKFEDTADVIARKVRAMNPEPIAWTEYQGNQLRVISGRALGSVDWSQIAGETLEVGQVMVSDQRVLVCCGKGTRYELLQVQPAGKKQMSSLDWARGLREVVRFV